MQLLHNASASSASVKVKNAMNPIVKMLLCVVPLTVGMMFWGDTWVKVIGAAAFGIFVIAAIGAYVYFMLKNPQMLQSEEYQIQRQALEIIQQQGIRGTVELVSVPSQPQIEAKGGAA